jgi:hypothetical protein
MAATRTRSAPAAGGAAEANEGQRRRQGDVVELINRHDFTHETPFAAASQSVLSHTLTSRQCLRRTTSQTRKCLPRFEWKKSAWKHVKRASR